MNAIYPYEMVAGVKVKEDAGDRSRRPKASGGMNGTVVS